MAKTKTIFRCQECGATARQWQGQCRHCKSWNTLIEEQQAPPPQKGMALHLQDSESKVVAISEVQEGSVFRFSSHIPEVDRLLGGGIVPGSMILLGGPPGVGKSTLVLQLAGQLAREHSILYVSGEESLQQIKLRAQRLNTLEPQILLVAENCLEKILVHLQNTQPKVVVVDSIQTIFSQEISAAPGSVTQVRECAAALMRYAKTHQTAVILIGHVTKEGRIAGPKVLEHLVDTVLLFDEYENSHIRLLRCEKNRFGQSHEIGIFQMSACGLEEIQEASSIFISQHRKQTSGNIIYCSIEGTRPILIEVQALVVPSFAAEKGAPAIRRCVGLDPNRLSLLLAVLRKHFPSLKLGLCDVFIKVAGGYRVQEPGIDLAVLLAIVSSKLEVPLDNHLAALAEIGLASEVRPVPQLEYRLKELQRMGFKKVFTAPTNDKLKKDGFGKLKVHFANDLASVFKELHLSVRT